MISWIFVSVEAELTIILDSNLICIPKLELFWDFLVSSISIPVCIKRVNGGYFSAIKRLCFDVKMRIYFEFRVLVYRLLSLVFGLTVFLSKCLDSKWTPWFSDTPIQNSRHAQVSLKYWLWSKTTLLLASLPRPSRNSWGASLSCVPTKTKRNDSSTRSYWSIRLLCRKVFYIIFS